MLQILWLGAIDSAVGGLCLCLGLLLLRQPCLLLLSHLGLLLEVVEELLRFDIVGVVGRHAALLHGLELHEHLLRLLLCWPGGHAPGARVLDGGRDLY